MFVQINAYFFFDTIDAKFINELSIFFNLKYYFNFNKRLFATTNQSIFYLIKMLL